MIFSMRPADVTATTAVSMTTRTDNRRPFRKELLFEFSVPENSNKKLIVEMRELGASVEKTVVRRAKIELDRGSVENVLGQFIVENANNKFRMATIAGKLESEFLFQKRQLLNDLVAELEMMEQLEGEDVGWLITNAGELNRTYARQTKALLTLALKVWFVRGCVFPDHPAHRVFSEVCDWGVDKVV